MAEVLFYETVIGPPEAPTCRVAAFLDDLTGAMTRVEMVNTSPHRYQIYIGSALSRLVGYEEEIPRGQITRVLPALLLDFRSAVDVLCGIEGL